MYIGIDVGTSGTKTLVCNASGRILAEATFEYPIYTPKPGWSEQDPADWWKASVKGVKAVMKKAGLKKDSIKGIGLSGQMHGSVFLDKTGKVIRKALLWNDQRTAKQCAGDRGGGGGKRRAHFDGVQPGTYGFYGAKILWLKENEPRHYEKVKKILLPKDYIRYLLTGEYASEVSDASGTLLLDVKNRCWHRGLVEKLGIDFDFLPSVYESCKVSGTLSKAGALELGLEAGVPVVGGGGDQPAGAVGNGIVEEGLLSATLGTSGVVFAHSREHLLDPSGRVHTMCASVEGEYCIFGCMLSAGGSLQWFRNQFAKEEVKIAKEKGVSPYDLLIKEAAKAPAGGEGLYFLPYLTGERTPYADPYARGAWVGITARTTRGMMIRSLLEGITFGMSDQIQIMRQMGIKTSQVRASGSGAMSKWWRQLQSDIYNSEVVTINTSAGPAYGVAIMAMVGTGEYDSVGEACKAAIKIKTSAGPDKKKAEFYRKHYELFGKLYRDLKDDFRKM